MSTNTPLTAQSIFDQVVEHLRKQQMQSSDADKCRYRLVHDKETLKCAAGCLITDEEYQPWMDEEWDDTTLESILGNLQCPQSLKERLGNFIDLIGDLQNIHDNCGTSQWERSWRVLAGAHKLKYTAPE